MTATTETRAEKMNALLTRLEEGVANVLTSEEYQQYLAAMSRFHGYSFNNTLLIMLTRPDATHVAGFNTWKAMGRMVRKGEKGIPIMVPYRGKVSEDENGEGIYAVRGFGVGYVFDISQTDGDALPEATFVSETFSTHQESERLKNALADFIRAHDATMTITESGTRGYWDPARREIGLRSDLDGVSCLKTLAHETAHMLADHRGGADQNDAEDVAESAAYVTLAHFGIDTSDYSFGYVAGWAKDMTVVKRNLSDVQQIAHQMIEAMEGTEA